RDLVLVERGVVPGNLAQWFSLALGDAREVAGDLAQRRGVERGAKAELARPCADVLGRRKRSAVRERPARRVSVVESAAGRALAHPRRTPRLAGATEL